MTFRQFSTKRSLVGATIAAVGVVAVVGGWASISNVNGAGGGDGGRAAALAVSTVTLEKSSGYEVRRQYTGRVDARRTSALSFERAGRLAAVLVAEGQAISAGSAMAKLDTRKLQAERRQLVAQRDVAAAVLDEMIAGPRQEDIDEAGAQVEAYRAREKRLQIRAERLTKLQQSNAANRDELDEAVFERQAVAAELRAAEHRLLELRNGTRAEQVRAQRATAAAFEARIAAIDVDLEDSVIKAPYDGRVDRRLVDEGTIIAVGEPVLRLVEQGAPEVWVGLPVHAADAVRAGGEYEVEIGGDVYRAKLAARMPQVDATTRTVNVVLAVAASGKHGAAGRPQIVSGQIARLRLDQVVESAGFWLPIHALVKGRRGLWSTYVVEANVDGGSPATGAEHDERAGGGHRVQRADVEVLHMDGDRAYVRGAIASGDWVVAGGVDRIVAGHMVRPIDRRHSRLARGASADQGQH